MEETVTLSDSVAGFDYQQQEQYIKQWTPKVQRALTAAVLPLSNGKQTSFVTRGSRKEEKLSTSITGRNYRRGGTTDLISFHFERHGVFVHKGVGRGWEMSGGFVVRTAKGPMSAVRTPFEWFNPTLDRFVPLLADMLARVNANAALNTAKLRIS